MRHFSQDLKKLTSEQYESCIPALWGWLPSPLSVCALDPALAGKDPPRLPELPGAGMPKDASAKSADDDQDHDEGIHAYSMGWLLACFMAN